MVDSHSLALSKNDRERLRAGFKKARRVRGAPIADDMEFLEDLDLLLQCLPVLFPAGWDAESRRNAVARGDAKKLGTAFRKLLKIIEESHLGAWFLTEDYARDSLHFRYPDWPGGFRVIEAFAVAADDAARDIDLSIPRVLASCLWDRFAHYRLAWTVSSTGFAANCLRTMLAAAKWGEEKDGMDRVDYYLTYARDTAEAFRVVQEYKK
jgi:hypothetical protein